MSADEDNKYMIYAMPGTGKTYFTETRSATGQLVVDTDTILHGRGILVNGDKQGIPWEHAFPEVLFILNVLLKNYRVSHVVSNIIQFLSVAHRFGLVAVAIIPSASVYMTRIKQRPELLEMFPLATWLRWHSDMKNQAIEYGVDVILEDFSELKYFSYYRKPLACSEVITTRVSLTEKRSAVGALIREGIMKWVGENDMVYLGWGDEHESVFSSIKMAVHARHYNKSYDAMEKLIPNMDVWNSLEDGVQSKYYTNYYFTIVVKMFIYSTKIRERTLIEMPDMLKKYDIKFLGDEEVEVVYRDDGDLTMRFSTYEKETGDVETLNWYMDATSFNLEDTLMIIAIPYFPIACITRIRNMNMYAKQISDTEVIVGQKRDIVVPKFSAIPEDVMNTGKEDYEYVKRAADYTKMERMLNISKNTTGHWSVLKAEIMLKMIAWKFIIIIDDLADIPQDGLLCGIFSISNVGNELPHTIIKRLETSDRDYIVNFPSFVSAGRKRELVSDFNDEKFRDNTAAMVALTSKITRGFTSNDFITLLQRGFTTDFKVSYRGSYPISFSQNLELSWNYYTNIKPFRSLFHDWVTSQNINVKLLSTFMRIYFGIPEKTLHYARLIGLIAVKEGRVTNIFNGQITANINGTPYVVSGHMVNMLLLTHVMEIDLERYFQSIINNLYLVMKDKDVVTRYKTLENQGKLAEGNWIVGNRLWHSFIEYEAAVAAYVVLCRWLGRINMYAMRKAFVWLKMFRRSKTLMRGRGWEVIEYQKTSKSASR
jgi:hypothetical protein